MITLLSFSVFAEGATEYVPSDTLSGNQAQQTVSVTALATMETPYHQITALFIEYPEAVVCPPIEDYSVVDFQTFNLKEVYENRPYEMGSIAAVYTNNIPEIRKDKTSIEGRYVVIELNPVDGSYWDEKANMWRPQNIAGIATVRLDGANQDYYRQDYSLFVITQNHDVVNSAGKVVATKGVLPSIPKDEVRTPEMDCFTQEMISSYNGKYNIYFNLFLPDGYDDSKEYPIVFCQPGMGGSLDYTNTDASGNWIGIGGNSTRDAVPIAMARIAKDREMIVVAVQPWTSAPKDWVVDNPGDFIHLIEYMNEKYAVDESKVYVIGNSMGTLYTSIAIGRRPDLFTAYAQCNGAFTKIIDGKYSFFNIFKNEIQLLYPDSTEKEILAICNIPSNLLDQSTLDAKGEAFLSGVLENEIPISFFDGANTEVLSPLYTVSPYMYLKSKYEAKGYNKAQISELLRFDLADREEYLKYGVCEYHESTKIVVTEDYGVIDWLLSRSKK